MTIKLIEAVDMYINLKRSLGAVFKEDARILRSLGRALGDIYLEEIDCRAVHDFCRGKGPPTRTWKRKDTALRGFFAYLVARRHITACPLPEQRPKILSSFRAHIYSTNELQRLLDATVILKSSRSPLRHKTFRALILTLYVVGLRAGEGLRLRCRDVDFRERVFTISDTKFFKSRLVPFGAALGTELEAYYRERRHLPMPDNEHSAFFASHKGSAVPLSTLESVFARLRTHVGLQDPQGGSNTARLHDLRHTFAVNRLVAWYREGADVQACLPLLSTYLGHSSISGTQTYLTMTPELLTEASECFARYAAS